MTSAATAYATRSDRRPTRPPQRANRKLERRLLWWMPPITFVFVSGMYFYLDKACVAILGAMIVVWLCKRPGSALKWLIVGLPFSTLTLSALYRYGAPYQLVRGLAFWKEILVVAVLTAALVRIKKDGFKPDLLDLFAVGYVLLALGYLLLPDVFIDGFGAVIPIGNRLNGFRGDAMYIALFFGARHARIPGMQTFRASRAFGAAAGICAAIGLFEYVRSGWWNTFVTQTLGLTNYKIAVLRVIPGSDPYLYDIRVNTAVAGRTVLRIGGVVVDYQQFAFLMVIAVALLAEHNLRKSNLRKPWMVLALPLAVGAVILTQTRSAFLALGVTLLLAIVRVPGRMTIARVRMAIAVGAIGLVSIPIVFSIGLDDRLAGKDVNSSNAGHSNSVRDGLEIMFDRPLGTGLATAAGAGQRGEDTSAITVTENQFLQIGTQLGIVGLLLWIGTLGTLLVKLSQVVSRRSKGREDTDADDPLLMVASGTRTALLALLPAMLFLQLYIWFPVSWTIWGLAGAALGAAERPDLDESSDEYAEGLTDSSYAANGHNGNGHGHLLPSYTSSYR